LFLKKTSGRFNGWIGYTWSSSRSKFQEINQGNSFPANNDITHDIAVVSMVHLNDKLTFSANWIYQTGPPATIPYGNYTVDGKVVHAFTPRNAYRMPAYHRLDIGLNWQVSHRSALNFTVYNAYGHKNAYAILFEENERIPAILTPTKLSLFSFVPSFSYQYNF
jgi:hypothetical protein